MTEILGYKPAKIYKAGTRLYIGFYIVEPSTGKLERKRIYINGIKDPVERSRYVSDAIKKINEKLREGWNPLIDDQSGKMFTRFVEVLDEIFEYKKAILRQRSVHTYSSRVKTIKEWLNKIGKGKIWVYEFNGQMAWFRRVTSSQIHLRPLSGCRNKPNSNNRLTWINLKPISIT